MLVSFSPFSFLFTVTYVVVFIGLPSLTNFIYFWLGIELLMLIFMGISYTLFIRSISSLIAYFFVQSLASFLIVLSYLFDLSLVFTSAILLNLGMFPFLFWFISSVANFPNLIFLLSATLHNVPPVILLLQFSLYLTPSVFWLSSVLSALVCGGLMLSCSDLRLLLVLSSVGNNPWLLLAQQSGFLPLCFYFVFYSLSLSLLIVSLFNSYSFVLSNWKLSGFLLLSLSGLPPFPLFFCKMYIISSLFTHPYELSPVIVLFLVSTTAVVVSYVSYLMTYSSYQHSWAGAIK